jgi:hypothetical protein
MGLSREPADFAFASYVKTKSGDINSTEGKNVLQAMNQSAPSIQSGTSSGSGQGGNGDVMAAKNNSSAETSKGATVNLNA